MEWAWLMRRNLHFVDSEVSTSALQSLHRQIPPGAARHKDCSGSWFAVPQIGGGLWLVFQILVTDSQTKKKARPRPSK
jgi:hypothetical protein